MQNAYASPGGYLDIAGFDISGAANRVLIGEIVERRLKSLAGTLGLKAAF